MTVGPSLFKTAHRPATGVPKDRKRRVLIVDDHPIVRQGLRRLIEAEADLEVCGEAETAREAKSLIRELEPDAVIVDVSLKQGDGLELVKDARAHYPSLPLLVLSTARGWDSRSCATGRGYLEAKCVSSRPRAAGRASYASAR